MRAGLLCCPSCELETCRPLRSRRSGAVRCAERTRSRAAGGAPLAPQAQRLPPAWGPESITLRPLYDKLIGAGRHVERGCSSSLPASPAPSCGGARRAGWRRGERWPGRGAARSGRKPRGGAGSNRTPADSCSTALIRTFLDRAISSDSLQLCL